MAHIIVKIPHVSGKGSAANMVSYIAKREGVDKSVNQKVTIKPPTEKQMTYIEEMVKMCPDAKESFEYEDYIENPTRQNASALISVVAESNPQLFENRETYLNYIATRPNVEKFESMVCLVQKMILTLRVQRVNCQITEEWFGCLSYR